MYVIIISLLKVLAHVSLVGMRQQASRVLADIMSFYRRPYQGSQEVRQDPAVSWRCSPQQESSVPWLYVLNIPGTSTSLHVPIEAAGSFSIRFVINSRLRWSGEEMGQAWIYTFHFYYKSRCLG